MLPSASDHLPRVRLFNPKDVRDVTVRIVERLSKDVRRSFNGRQPFQQEPHPHLQRLPSFRSLSRIGFRVDWLWQPRCDVRLSARAGRLQYVDRQSRRRRNEKYRGIPDHPAIGSLPAHPNVLHNVLGFRWAMEHSVGDAEETRTYAQERREAVVVRCRRIGSAGRM